MIGGSGKTYNTSFTYRIATDLRREKWNRILLNPKVDSYILWLYHFINEYVTIEEYLNRKNTLIENIIAARRTDKL